MAQENREYLSKPRVQRRLVGVWLCLSDVLDSVGVCVFVCMIRMFVYLFVLLDLVCSWISCCSGVVFDAFRFD